MINEILYNIKNGKEIKELMNDKGRHDIRFIEVTEVIYMLECLKNNPIQKDIIRMINKLRRNKR